MQKKEKIKSLYLLSLEEGEGLGTAYEYYAKLRKLKKFINSMEKPKRILMAGLPEKYGLSMDFFFLGQILEAETAVVDERAEVLERAQDVLRILIKKKIFGETKVLFFKADRIEDLTDLGWRKEEFDLALSNEVLQRLHRTQGLYISNIKKLAKNFALFAPNRENKSHTTSSGLTGVSLEELLARCNEGDSSFDIFDYGYLDMPPFPPGLSRAQEKRKKAAESRLEAFLMKGLEIYSMCESITPKFIKKKKAHIVYVLAKASSHG